MVVNRFQDHSHHTCVQEPKVVQAYRDRAAVEAPYELRRHPEPLRLTLLAVPIRPCMYKRSGYLYF